MDAHGNPIEDPRRFSYDLSGTATHGDAQIRHTLSQLLRWAQACEAKAIAVEDLDFSDAKSREKHGRKKRFRQLISGMPTATLRARLVSMADTTGIAMIAVDPAYTSTWGAQNWQHPTTDKKRKTSRPRCGEHRDRAARSGVSDPASDGTAPHPPERWVRASDRPDRTGHL
ncbi:IS200/IS605 family accessory protein TnpB-related protein [Nocardiopsis valliformis]|uniref:IS200/IS605 family accessory protein TnpB-related protein n=1 Tax=Nocardiopsis valliformis TaxID=239974 RepID=UPI0003450488|nr:IS200/IS605 family accessory protein TnpB-related protein [Nocardiopsis valliformis]